MLRDRPYALLALLNALMLLRMPLLSLALPLWIVERTAAPGWTVSALFVLNTGVVMLFQVRAARSVTDLATAARAVRWSGAVMCAACAVFALSGALPGSGDGAGAGAAGAAVAVLVLGAVLQVLAEMRHSAGAWQIGFALAPADRIGQYQGFYGSGVPVARTLGPCSSPRCSSAGACPDGCSWAGSSWSRGGDGARRAVGGARPLIRTSGVHPKNCARAASLRAIPGRRHIMRKVCKARNPK